MFFGWQTWFFVPNFPSLWYLQIHRPPWHFLYRKCGIFTAQPDSGDFGMPKTLGRTKATEDVSTPSSCFVDLPWRIQRRSFGPKDWQHEPNAWNPPGKLAETTKRPKLNCCFQQQQGQGTKCECPKIPVRVVFFQKKKKPTFFPPHVGMNCLFFRMICSPNSKESLKPVRHMIWAIYNDLSRGHPKWWFSKGILPEMVLN